MVYYLYKKCNINEERLDFEMDNKKKIYKIEEGKKICGVCGGIAEYFNIDPVIVRVIWGILAFAYGTGIIAYFICAFVFPNKSDVQ